MSTVERFHDAIEKYNILLSKQVSYCSTNYHPSCGPRLIGLTGRIATGKSSIFKRLVNKGAYPVDCDKVCIIVHVHI